MPNACCLPQKLERTPSNIDGVVAVAAELDVNAVRIARVIKRLQERGEFHLTLAEHQVIVDAAAHVLDMHIPENVSPLCDVRGPRLFPLAMQMTQVQREPEARRTHRFE